ncbi:MAG: hypothetical protein JOZ50_10590 [Candidatus Eremiobacteraeota bacterium]|nr:hypothetical protein [Candidatus Eremiobacteraeota bacterium]
MKTTLCTVCCALFVAWLLLSSQPATTQPLSSLYSNLRYRAIGPAISGGRVTAVAGTDLDAQLYYAGGADGGVFKSHDGGITWFSVFDRQPVAAIGALAIDPRNPNIVWAGTGEANPRNEAASGDGMWYSSDGAKTWRHVGLDEAGAISIISIDPRASTTVVAGVLGREFADSAVRGVYLTTDNGQHWSRRLYLGPSSGVSDIVRLPNKPSTLFAGLWQFRRTPWTMTSGGPAGGIYRSDDGGKSWKHVTAPGLPTHITGRIGLAASGNMLYARIQSTEGFVWRSTDQGATWKRMPPSRYIGGRGFYFSRIFADPSNEQRVINLEGVASISSNGAQSFSQTSLHAGYDFHIAWWSRDGKRIIVGSDEGLVISHDGAEHWFQPYDLPFSQIYHVGVDQVAPYYHVCIGLQDNDSWCAPQSVPNQIGVLNRDWVTVAPGDGMWSVFDPLDQNLLWSTETGTSSGQLFLTDFRTGQQAAISPIPRLTFGEAANTYDYRFNWDSPIAFTTGPRPRALLGGNVVFASTDRGQTWQVISPDLTRNDRTKQGASGGPVQRDMSDAEVYDTIMYLATTPLDSAVIWAGTDDGLVQLSRDSGATWKNVTPPSLPAWTRVMGMDVGHRNAGTVYAVADGHMSGDERPYIFASDDFGGHWRSIAGDLPANLFVRSIREDPKNNDVLYAGTQRGVWISFDSGNHWNDLRLNMPATAVYDLEIQPDQNDLVVGTHGRGVWILDDLTPLQQLGVARERPLVLFAPRPAYRMFATPPINNSIYAAGGPVAENLFVGENAPNGAIINYFLGQPSASTNIEITDATGRVVRHLKGKAVTGSAGINRASWNLTEDGPVPWNASIDKDIEPANGAEVLPGTYNVVVHAAGRDERGSLLVKQDPRDNSSLATYQQRHDALAQLTSELSDVDVMLNAIDAMNPAPPAYVSVKADLTSGQCFDEDNISRPAALRERLLDMLSQLSSSYQAPTNAQAAEIQKLRQDYLTIAARYRELGGKQ